MRSYELKLAWAKHQSEVLKDQIAAWHDAGGYGVVVEDHPNEPSDIRLKVSEMAPGVPLIIGDALYALRSALDHLTHDLASSFTNPLPKEASELSEFPIYGNKPLPKGVADRKLGCMDPKARAIIERLQPHQRGNAYADDPLWHLYELARLDRHRFIHVTVAMLQGVGIYGDNLHVEAMVLFGPDPTAGNDAKLGQAILSPIDPGRPMDVKFKPDPQVVFKEGAFAGTGVLDALAKIQGHIEAEVLPNLQPFLNP